jgi:hypothetical protein
MIFIYYRIPLNRRLINVTRPAIKRQGDEMAIDNTKAIERQWRRNTQEG